ncbi:hypothetical protein [Cyanobium sp. Morenito 9A2]|uniref:hypothetical protein n=1 Tax=Cyanobium sp. Morenito 9A2 TaxID=2823718 RepID=UPI0020CE68B0|nr:hypothetical protein [Cyanobium sp. Morenito 9A2]MCP9848898.1 hypothetical protein [Cyanobium sp. Morenito 9A2]
MTNDATSLFVGLMVSLIGGAYVLYGRKQGHTAALLCGLLLTLIPWFLTNPLALAISCVLLMGLPLWLR